MQAWKKVQRDGRTSESDIRAKRHSLFGLVKLQEKKWCSQVYLLAVTKNRLSMRFFKEVWGFIIEFNSIGDYLSFMLGRLLGVIIIVGILILLFYFL